ncbi:unnamed protein product, partial [Symbiodinium necroappetens]
NQFHRRPAPVASPYGDGSKRQRTEQPKPPCAFFRVGRCAKGANCPYSHKDGEVAEVRATNVPSAGNSLPVTVAVPEQRKVPQVVPPPADRPVVRRSPAPVPADDPSTMFKRTLCKFFLNGCCVKGEMCTFAHGEHELQQPAEGWMNSARGEYRPDHYKTRMCKFFLEGNCAIGDECRYAHDENELPTSEADPLKDEGAPRPPGEKHVFFKTRLCHLYFKGMCHRGSACNYAHGEEELQKPAVSEGEPGTSSNFGIVVPSMTSGATEKLGDSEKELADRALCSS